LSEDIYHECGVAALYWLDEPVARKGPVSKLAAGEVAKFMPTMLLNLQNRGQLAAGLSSFDPGRPQILDTFKDLGSVAEAFRMSHPTKHAAIMR
jgi:amidophosphoribosyltransferase